MEEPNISLDDDMEEPDALIVNKVQTKKEPPIKKLSILGLRGAGKSTFMAVLNVALTDSDNPSKWIITALDDHTNSLVYKYENMLFNEGIYPDANLQVDDIPMKFSATKNAEMGGLIPGGNFQIIAKDIPGEAVKGIVSEHARFRDFYKEHVAESAAIIFLLDPHENWRKVEKEEGIKKFNYFPLFRSILTELKQKSPNAYLAFGVTKIDDLPDGLVAQNNIRNIKKLAEDRDEETAKNLSKSILGKQTIDWLEQNFNEKHVSWWMVSATGFIVENEKNITQTIQKNVDGITKSFIKDPSIIKPIGVIDIVEWSLNRIAREAENQRPSALGGLGKFVENLF